MSEEMPPVAGAQTAGQLVYAIGDVHGCYDALAALLGDIAADVRRTGGERRPVLIFCGDYVDRGPQSARVLSTLVWLQRHGDFELHLLMGNHERAMLDFIAEPVAARDWIGFGGDATLRAYGVAPPVAEKGETDLLRARDDLLDNLPVAHLRLLEGLEMIVGVGDYAFVHAGIRPGVPLRKQVEADMLWIREPFLDAEGAHEKIIVHGHTWEDDQPQILPNRIGIDTGTYSTGVLTAVRLDDGAIEVMQASAA